jgi:16S rRNA A1518/A1519 N6-dimethyltransferase RsmA/KsgA/DIM1 with predicted DNA glycosylase/AP lyase activity
MPMTHIEDTLLEQYAMSVLPEQLTAEVEEHLLTCLFCQNRLVATDRFLAVFREAARRLDAEPISRGKRLQTVRIGWWGAGIAAIFVFLVLMIPRHHTQPAPAILLMQSLRGPESGAHMSAGESRLLVFDIALPSTDEEYNIELVDAVGNRLLEKTSTVKDGRLSVVVQKMGRGSYWVRIYRKAQNDLLAEYGLGVE